MNAHSEPENRLVCPNCQALNTPYTVICASCGVDMDAFRASMPRLQRLKLEEAASHREQLRGEMGSWLREENKISGAGFKRLMIGLVVAAVFVGILVCLGSYLYANRYRKSQDEIRALNDSSMLCLAQNNYVCARDGFKTLKLSGRTGLDGFLNLAQFGLAQQYMDSGQPEQAVAELRELLQRDPGNQPAVEMLKLSYERWITQLDKEGNQFALWFVTRERDARFPEEASATPTPTSAPGTPYP